MTVHDEPQGAGTPLDGATRESGFSKSPESVRDYVSHWWQGIRAGDLGSLPIILGLVLIAAIFGILEDSFLTARNFTNLLLQMAPVATIAIGIVFVLLIGEIDLSVAWVAGLAGVVMTLLLRPGDPGWPWWAAIAAAVGVAMAIGVVQSLIVTKAGVPSFVVTLAGFLIWQGTILILTTQFSSAGTIRIQDNVIIGIANNFLTDFWGWVLGGVIVASYALSQFFTARSRLRRGLGAKPTLVIVAQITGLTIITFAAVYVANLDRGVPMVTLILGVFLALWSFVASRMRFGRHVYAVGGNPEAARRAGIVVDRVRIKVFLINGFMAGLGGIILASRLRSVASGTGGGNLLLSIIAAAVIGGTSLFGGTGRVVSALYGALVIVSIQNGMDLFGVASGTKFIVTGIVLLAAVLLDSLTKRRRAAQGVS